MDENKTIAQVVKDSLCTGCGTCIALCPNSAIELTMDEKKGIYVPRIDEEKCKNCGICFKVCPGHEVDFKGLNLEIFGEEPENILIGNYLDCYVGHSMDYDIRYNSASGGLVSQLLIFALEVGMIDGALVTRMNKNNPLEPEPFIARTKEEIIEASGSKYCPVPANIALKEILESEEGEKFAVVGLPCHIHGVLKAKAINKKIREMVVLHIGIICMRTPNFRATEWLLQRNKIKKEEVKRIEYRGGGYPGGMTILSHNDSPKFLKLLDNGYLAGFLEFFFPNRCTICYDFLCEFSDISIGDAFFIPEIRKNDKVGSSAIISRTPMGNNILKKCFSKNLIKLEKMNSEAFICFQNLMEVYFKKKPFWARASIFRLLNRKLPTYHIVKSLNPSIVDYLNSLYFYLFIWIGSKKRLWCILHTYITFRKLVGAVLKRLKRL